jgi:hypothetical protein
MENLRKLHTAILAVMSKVQYLNKSESVQNFKAVSSEKVISAVRDAMIENLLTIRPLIIEPSRTHEFWDEGGKRKNQFVTHTLVTFRIEHAETGEYLDFMSDGTGIDALDKAPGKAMTYALKSALLNVFMIPTGHKQDVIADEEAAKPELKPNTPLWGKGLEALIAGNTTIEVIDMKYNISSLNLLKLADQAREVINA